MLHPCDPGHPPLCNRGMNMPRILAILQLLPKHHITQENLLIAITKNHLMVQGKNLLGLKDMKPEYTKHYIEAICNSINKNLMTRYWQL